MPEPTQTARTGRRDRAAIGRANLAKSKHTERQLVAYLRANGWPGAERTARPGYQAGERGRPDVGDIDGCPGLVWQVKNVDQRKHHLVPDWLAETEAQRAAAHADHGVLVVKRAGHAYCARWWAYLPLDVLVRLVGGDLGVHLGRIGPVRLELCDLVPLLHVAGYGTALREAS